MSVTLMDCALLGWKAVLLTLRARSDDPRSSRSSHSNGHLDLPISIHKLDHAGMVIA